MKATTKLRRRTVVHGTGMALAGALAGCSSTPDAGDEESTDGGGRDAGGMATDTSAVLGAPTDPAGAPRAEIDRFSDAAGTLHMRSKNSDLPGPDEPIDFDSSFLARGLGPEGNSVEYYDFDVQPTEPAPIYALFYENGDPVENQLNIVDVAPGDEGYNDFWRVNKVTVPDSYEANMATSVGDIEAAGFAVEQTNVIKNCPVVPEGSTASMRGGDAPSGLVSGWYEDSVVSYFLFEESPLMTSGGGMVPLSPIYVSFNTNPGEDGGGPPSGFKTEGDSGQTHNVVGSLPGDSGYSPLWTVNVYDNADFDAVSDLESASDASILATGVATVNCPIVST